MSFLIYLFVLLLGATSVLFGLDLLNSPLHRPPNVPMGRSVRHVAAGPPAAHEVKTKTEVETEVKKQEVVKNMRKSATGHMLPNNHEPRPMFSAGPGQLPDSKLVTTGEATADDTAATESHDVAVAIKSNADEPVKPFAGQEAAQANEMTSAKTVLAADGGDLQNTESPRAQNNSCRVGACAAAYRSFRASDCTYQPIHGPRLLCTKSDGTDAASMAHAPHRSARRRARSDDQGGLTRIGQGKSAGPGRPQVRRDDELSETARIVRQMTRGRDLGDIVVQRADGTIIIVHTGNARAEER